MSMRSSASVSTQNAFARQLTLVLSLSCLGVSAQAGTTDSAPEQERLTAALRQLDGIERLIAPEAERPIDEHARYFFDYARMRADVQRIRAGIQDYLTPSRAQPRDANQLFGDYRQTTVAPAEAEGPR